MVGLVIVNLEMGLRLSSDLPFSCLAVGSDDGLVLSMPFKSISVRCAAKFVTICRNF